MTIYSVLTPSFNISHCKYEIQFALNEFKLRGLKETTKWLAEMSCNLKVDPVHPGETFSENFYGNGDHFSKPDVSEKRRDVYERAKSYYDFEEYLRAAHCLKDAMDDDLCVFLHYYARYMAITKKHLYKCTVNYSVAARSLGSNEEMRQLKQELHQRFQSGKTDSYLAYLYALVLRKSTQIQSKESSNMIVEALKSSIKQSPMNWSSWNLLSNYVSENTKVNSLDLPAHWIRDLFVAQTNSDPTLGTQAIRIFKLLRNCGFNDCIHVKTKEAVAYYDRRDFDNATLLLEELRREDPYRLEDMDVLSNMYYVNNRKAELSNLAHHCSEVDKFRVETCCVIGNYYSIRTQHDKAVLYFQRALKINPNYLSAWTLIGHEYTEVKNTSAAIQAYRNAIDLNPKDYRAWYGLGQAYEILKIYKFSLYYYKQAQRLRAFDSRMAMAVGDIYDTLLRYEDAKVCYRTAVAVGDMEGTANYKIAKLFAKEGSLSSKQEAAKHFKMYVIQAESQGIPEGSTMHHEAYNFLANFHFDTDQDLDKAKEFATKCLEFSEYRDAAKQLLGKVDALKQSSEQSMHIEVDNNS